MTDLLPELSIVTTVRDIETPAGIIPAGSVATILHVDPTTRTYTVEFEDFDMPETLAMVDVKHVKIPLVIVEDMKTYRAEDVPEEFLEALEKELDSEMTDQRIRWNERSTHTLE